MSDPSQEAIKGHEELMDAQAPPVAEKSIADRMGALEQMKEQGLVTDAEYAEKRSAILGGAFWGTLLRRMGKRRWRG